jgi:NAD(P)H-dependent flavin oxidoreductase YrpB (nitropropane dioxygenase family)
MSKRHLAAVVSALLFLRWLATAHVAVTAAGIPVVVPALVVAAVVVAAVAAAVVALVVYRMRAERAVLAAWQVQKAATS